MNIGVNMQVSKISFEKVVGPFEGDQGITVSMFVVSKKNPGLKKLNLEGLNSDQRAAKLHRWGQEHRFVAVIEMGDKVFAHTHVKYAEQLGKNDLSIDGKKVSIKALTDEEADKLSLTFKSHLLEESEESQKEETTPESIDGRSSPVRQFLATNLLISDNMHKDHLIAKINLSTSQIILDCLRQIAEARREQEKQKAEEEKYFRIKEQEIQRAETRSVITKEDVASQETKRAILVKDMQSFEFARLA
jgi:hypothetical protein